MPGYYHAKFDGNWTTNKGETEGGTIYIYIYLANIFQGRIEYELINGIQFIFDETEKDICFMI